MDNIPASHQLENNIPLVLIVDDEAAIVETLAEFMKELGYVSLVAYNGLQALEFARQRWPSLVITDLMMPVLDGARLIEALRAEAALRSVSSPPVILLTAVGVRAINGVHADATLAKPFDLDKLEAVIQRLLRKSSQ